MYEDFYPIAFALGLSIFFIVAFTIKNHSIADTIIILIMLSAVAWSITIMPPPKTVGECESCIAIHRTMVSVAPLAGAFFVFGILGALMGWLARKWESKIDC